MITVLSGGRVIRQAPATLHTRRYWMEAARSSPVPMQVWETSGKRSTRLN